MIEEWKSIPGYEGFYAASNDGRIKSLARTVFRPIQGTSLPICERILRPGRSTSGYPQVVLCRDGKPKMFAVHQLVLLAFCGPAPRGMQACHGNGNPDDNRAENLRWDTKSANNLDSVRHGTHYQASQTACIHGHPFDETNTYLRSNGRGRDCRTCMRERPARARLNQLEKTA